MYNCLAIDIGAGSGRVIRGIFDNATMAIEQVYRFENGIEMIDGHYRWNVDTLLIAVFEGLTKASGKKTKSIGVDSWGVDFVLLDKKGEKLELPVAYRDDRTKGMMERFFTRMSKNKLYAITGIQFVEFNTIFQFMSMIEEKSILLDNADTFLMIADFINYKLSGKKVNEFTNVSTTQMMNAATGTWDREILTALGLNAKIFQPPCMPGTLIGPLSEIIAGQTGLGEIPVYCVASHDTGSAVAASPSYGKDWAYISSGTWCLMGVESESPLINEKTLEYNFTNEGGINGTSRILKNIMGLWIIRGIKNSLNADYTYEDLRKMAEKSEPFKHIIYANDNRFYNPDSMCKAIDDFCYCTNQEPPQTPGEYIRCAEEGLAFLYAQVLGELRDIYAYPINRLHILGGGVMDTMMCQFTANATDLPVYAGPVEATAIGNLIVQAMALGRIGTLEEARKVVLNSFTVKIYKPANNTGWCTAYQRYLDIKEKAR